MNNATRLGEESVGKLLVRLSIPAMIGMIVNALYNVVDRIFIGQTEGSLAIAGLTISFPIMIIIMAFGMLIGVGGTALISLNLGKGDKDTAEKVLGTSIFMMLITGVSLSTIGLIFNKPLLLFFNASNDVLPYAQSYLGIILFGSTLQMVSFGVNRFIGAEGNAMMAMYTMLIGAISNIILDAIFILMMGMGVKGAALGTIIAQGISATWVLSYYLRDKSVVKFHKHNFKFNFDIAKSICAVGSAPFAMQIAGCAIVFLFNKALITHGGDLAISAYGIIHSLSMFILMPVFGINQGTQPIIGFNYGAKKYDRVKKALGLASLSATVLVTIGFLFSRIAPELLISIYNSKDAELIKMGSEAVRIYMIMFPVIGFQVLCSNYFQATGKPKKAMFLSLTRQVIFLIPLILILPQYLGLKGIWLVAPISDGLAGIVTAVAIIIEFKHLDNDGDLDVKPKINMEIV